MKKAEPIPIVYSFCIKRKNTIFEFKIYNDNDNLLTSAAALVTTPLWLPTAQLDTTEYLVSADVL